MSWPRPLLQSTWAELVVCDSTELPFEACCLGDDAAEPCWQGGYVFGDCCEAPHLQGRVLRYNTREAIYAGKADAHLRYFLDNIAEYVGWSGALAQVIQVIAHLSTLELAKRVKNQVRLHSTGLDKIESMNMNVMAQVPVRLLDVGAAFYAENPGDLMMAARMLRSWGGCRTVVPSENAPSSVLVELNLEVYALEPQPSAFEATRGYLDTYLLEEERACLHLLNLAASDEDSELQLWGDGSTASLATHLRNSSEEDSAYLLGGQVDSRSDQTVPVVTIDKFAAENGITFLDFVKIDCEGMDWPVVLGMKDLIRDHRVEAISLEISEKMSPTTWRISQGREAPAQNIRDMEPPTLLSIMEWFDAAGYDGFLVGMQSLTPITGVWWKDDYEVCSNPARYFRKSGTGVANCWLDALFVSRRSPILAPLREKMRPATLGGAKSAYVVR